MNQFFTYLFWPNPGNAYYGSPKILTAMGVCAALIVASFAVSYWRRNKATPAMRKVSGSWASALLWFGIIGLALIVARVEQIQFVAMRFLWVLLLATVLFYVYFQWKRFRMRYYEVLPTEKTLDPRSQYLPKRKKKR